MDGRFAEVGFPTVGFDVDPEVVEGVSAGRLYVTDVADRALEGLARSGRLEATAETYRWIEEQVRRDLAGERRGTNVFANSMRSRCLKL